MRKWNFSSGPATIPESVLTEAQEELLNWQGSGMSVMEVSHRSDLFIELAATAKKDITHLLEIPDSYDVLFLQGGATMQFALIPMNFAKKNPDYLMTGYWSQKAISEAQKVTDVNIVASSQEQNFISVPDFKKWQLNDNASYLHYVANETIHGNAIHHIPDISYPLISDMSSVILSRPIDVNKFSMIYAGAQKNIGPAGLTLIIVNKDFLAQSSPNLPNIMNYEAHSKKDSMLNTPPTFSWYIAGKVFKWLNDQGGLKIIGETNKKKAETLYRFIDSSDFYDNLVESGSRSIMNIPFILNDTNLDTIFLDEAYEAGLLNLKGHRSVGGMRASIYNAMPQEAIDALIAFMKSFEARYG
tara:strand:- start:2424 stop:3494 length:1071 start_codon:yes stop_codon:yes gene_type:complete